MTDLDTPDEATLPTREPPGSPRVGVPVWVPALLALALVAALVAVGLLWRSNHDHEQAAAADAALISVGVDARKAAEEAAVKMTTYDYRTIDQEFAWVDTAGTEDFKNYFTGVSAPSIALVKQLKAAASGTVIDSGVVVEDATHAKVVLFLDQRIIGKAEGTSAPDQSRITMEMVGQGGRWLVDRVELKSYANN